jgi:hypothetical protein
MFLEFFKCFCYPLFLGEIKTSEGGIFETPLRQSLRIVSVKISLEPRGIEEGLSRFYFLWGLLSIPFRPALLLVGLFLCLKEDMISICLRCYLVYD